MNGLDVCRGDELERRLSRDFALRLTNMPLLEQELAVQVGSVDRIQINLQRRLAI